MLQTIKKAWAIPELRKKIVFTALILLIFRIGNAIPVPYVDTGLLSTYLQQMSTTVLGLYDVMSGGAFASATVFALGVQPYINSSIIIQLLTIEGTRDRMPANRMMEIPLPIPNSVICSPIHITKEEPAMKEMMMTSAAHTPVLVRMLAFFIRA